MEKRISRSDYMLAFLFIFMLTGIVAAFFYGMKTGESKAEARFEEMQNKKKEQAQELPAYHQQYLVSFYHTIFVPYIDFEKKWFSFQNDLEYKGGGADPAASLKSLSGLAENSYGSIVSMTMPASSPLLQEAQKQYLLSLKKFGSAFDNFRSRANSLQADELLKQLAGDSQYKEAIQSALSAQLDYYEAMGMWYKGVDATFAYTEYKDKPAVSTDEWSRMNLLAKNVYLSGLMASKGQYEPYMPQDLVSHVDDMIASGQAKKLNLTEVEQIAALLTSTDAVRPGDFLKTKAKFYSREPLPQLPFFLSEP